MSKMLKKTIRQHLAKMFIEHIQRCIRNVADLHPVMKMLRRNWHPFLGEAGRILL
jgi:hypothetical protein